jgi:hypothetical protein
VTSAQPTIPEEEMEDDDESRAFSAPSPLCSPPDSPESNAQEMEIPSTPPTRVAARSSGILNSAFERAMDRRDSGDLTLSLEPPRFHISGSRSR